MAEDKRTSRQLYAWSYSRVSDHETCASKCWWKHGAKLPEKQNKYMARGEDIHLKAELYVKGELPPAVPKELTHFAKDFKKERAQFAKAPTTVFAEKAGGRWAFAADWRPVEFFERTARCRMVVDLGILWKPTVLAVTDHKTGRIYPGHVDQMSLYALGGFNRYPLVGEVRVALRYLDQKHVNEGYYKREDEPGLREYWEQRADPLLSDRKFKPTPGPHCSSCAYGVSKGGPCHDELKP